MASSASNGRGRKGSGRRAPSRSAAGRGHMHLEFSFASDTTHAHEVQKQIVAAVESHEYNFDAIFAIKLALEEALINAVKHGNKLDPGKTVRVVARVSPKQCEIEIEDEGCGFARCDVPDPRLDENLEKCSGRGILLIEFYMDEAKWTNGGRKLRMIKRNEPSASERSAAS